VNVSGFKKLLYSSYQNNDLMGDLKDAIDSQHGLLYSSDEKSSQILDSLASLYAKNAEIKASLDLIYAKDSTLSKSSTIVITEVTAAQWATAQAQVTVEGKGVLLAAANANRKGFSVYNNSTANSAYIQASTNPLSQFAQVGTNASSAAQFQMFGPMIYTGPIYGRRNGGTGGGWCVEFI